jgi:hypothetical protein
VLAGQSESAAHATHVPVLESQILLVPVQSRESAQATHAPLESHFGAAPGQTVAAVEAVHDGWHTWSPGQHEGAEAPQSELDPHCSQRPVFVMQMGHGCAQSEFCTHPTQPTVGLHFPFPFPMLLH